MGISRIGECDSAAGRPPEVPDSAGAFPPRWVLVWIVPWLGSGGACCRSSADRPPPPGLGAQRGLLRGGLADQGRAGEQQRDHHATRRGGGEPSGSTPATRRSHRGRHTAEVEGAEPGSGWDEVHDHLGVLGLGKPVRGERHLRPLRHRQLAPGRWIPEVVGVLAGRGDRQQGSDREIDGTGCARVTGGGRLAGHARRPGAGVTTPMPATLGAKVLGRSGHAVHVDRTLPPGFVEVESGGPNDAERPDRAQRGRGCAER